MAKPKFTANSKSQFHLPLDFLTQAEYQQQMLDIQRRQAFEQGNASRYFVLCSHMGLEPGPDDADREMFLEGQRKAAEKDLDSQSLIARLNLEGKVPYIWGINQSELSRLKFRVLRTIFYGSHNITIPFKMKDVLLPDELLAKFYGARALKTRDQHLHGPRYAIGDIVKRMDNAAYPYLSPLAVHYKRKYPRARGSQQERVAGLPQVVQEIFVRSFYGPLICSDAETPGAGNVFHDPNIDGRSRDLYSREIYENLRRRWFGLGRE